MEIFYFLMLLTGTGVLMVLVFVFSYWYALRKFNNALRTHLEGKVDNIHAIRDTDFRFKVETKRIDKGPVFGGVQVGYGGSGSGLHYREVVVSDQSGMRSLLYAAIEVQFFQPVAIHVHTP